MFSIKTNGFISFTNIWFSFPFLQIYIKVKYYVTHLKNLLTFWLTKAVSGLDLGREQAINKHFRIFSKAWLSEPFPNELILNYFFFESKIKNLWINDYYFVELN